MKKYKLILLFTLLLLALTAFSTAAQAASNGTCGENLTWTLDDAGNLTISGTGAMEDYPWDQTGPWGTSIESVTIEHGVTSIGDSAFYNCDSIVSVTIPDSVTSIGGIAFSGCSGLESVYITDLGAYLNIDFYDNWSSYPMCCAEKLYLNGKRLVNAVIPDSVTQIPNYAFYNCDSLASVTIPDSVTSIGNSAFSGCSGLESVYITDLGAYLNIDFYDDWGSCPMSHAEKLYLNGEPLVDVIIPDSVTKISPYAFENCDSIKNVTIPGSVNSIGRNAFDNCSSLTRITIENGVRTIGDVAFYRCGRLETLELPNTITDIEVNAFYGCNRLSSVKYEGNDVEWTEIYIGSGNDALKTASISYGYILPVTVIYDANGGQNAPAAQKSDKNVSFTVSTAVPVRTDCKFLGWALEKDAKTAAIQPGSAVSVGEENITLYAVWQNIVSTSTVIARNTIMVTPKNAEPGNTILVVCYKGSEMVYWELYSYAGEAIVPFTPSVSYDTVRVAVWNGWLTPLSKAETKS